MQAEISAYLNVLIVHWLSFLDFFKI